MELAPIVTRNYYHSVEVTGNAILGDQHITIGPQERTAADGRRSHFLASIKDPDMNARRNDIHETKYDTFEWIMRDGAGDGEKMPNLTRWLSSRQGKFFIQGKAGSGKSTLMKFVVEHKKTRDLLSEWSRKCSLLFHAFWIAGSKIQRSFKGLLASLVFQIIQQNHHLLYKIVYDADAKTCLSDWSTKELSQLLLTLIHDRSHAYCIFVDGLDEHDNSEDIDVVLDLIEDLTALTNVKVCVSSRPVLHIIEWAAGSPMLSLHEVTANDIKTYVTKTLDSRLKSSHSSQDDLRGIDGLARELCEKANGVFLWIYYVMRNVLKCSRNGDNTDAIRKQVATLPAGMSALYRQMWERQNLDNKFYANEARKIFSHGFERPMNVFLFAVSMNTEIRMQYLSEVGRLDQTILNKLCQEARRKLITRCAGLLECVQNPYKKIYSPRYKRYIARGVDKTQPPWWKTCSIQYFHRTAYDFVNNSPDGSNLTVSMHPRPPIREIVEASLACFIEDVYPLTSDMVKEYCLMPLSKFVRSDHRFVEETMNSINRVCMTLLQQRLKVDDRLRKENWIVWLGMDYRPWTPIDLTSTLLHSNISSNWMLDYIRSCTDTWSPYYRGYAVLRASQAYSTKFLGQAQQDSVDLKMPLQVINMLVQRGADLCTPQCYLFMRDPEISSAGSYLLSLLARTILTSDLMLRLDELQSLSSTLLHSALPETFSLRLASSGYIRDTSWWSYTWDQGITVLLTFKSKDFLMILRRLLNNELRQHWYVLTLGFVWILEHELTFCLVMVDRS